MSDDLIVVAGGGGFIGGHLVGALRSKGYHVRSVDIKPVTEWYQLFHDVESVVSDLKLKDQCERSCRGAGIVYQLAADMGGIGFIEHNKALCMLSVLTNTHMLEAAVQAGVKRFFYASSACVYNADKQKSADVIALREEDAYPAMPEDGYGWEKLFSERMCRHFREDFGLVTRVARYHNVYGSDGTWEGGREMYIDDCIKGTQAILASDIEEPINLGSNELVTINRVVDIVEAIAGVKLKRNYDLGAPKGVNGRNSDNTRIRQLLDWEPSIMLAEGLEKTYAWIYDQYVAKYGRRSLRIAV